jgi:hypothetical protein
MLRRTLVATRKVPVRYQMATSPVEQSHSVGVLDVSPPCSAPRAERESRHGIGREEDVPLSNRLGLVVCRMRRGPLDGGERIRTSEV